MPSQPLNSRDCEIIHASILESRLDLWRLQRDLHDVRCGNRVFHGL
jgi:hypothetical protein